MDAFDIAIEGLHTETGPGVYEVAIRYDEALRAADKAALFKTRHEAALRAARALGDVHGEVERRAPGLERAPASVALERRTQNERLLRREARRDKLSKTRAHYLGGQVALMPELTALYSPTINSYKRYVPGVWAPLTATWGVENRTCAIRAIPGGREGDAARVPADRGGHQPVHRDRDVPRRGPLGHRERRSSRRRRSTGDASANWETSRPQLPRTLREATHRSLEVSRGARKVLGEAFVDHYVRTREWEVRQYERAVTDWELRRYFEADLMARRRAIVARVNG